MKACAPKYYTEFRCIADRCEHSCCIGWRISLDERTRALYQSACGEYSSTLKAHVSEDGDGFYIPTRTDGRCPHLDECGLCRVITNYGDGYLSDICREHPRYYNFIGKKIEVGLGASCPEAARLIICRESSLSLTEVDITDIAPCEGECEYSPLELRGRIAEAIDKSESYADAEAQISAMLGLPEYILSAELRSDAFAALEYLYPENREIIFAAAASESSYAPPELSQVLSYFIYRHLSAAESREEAVAIIGFALISARMVAEIAKAVGDITEALRIYSEEIEYSTDNTESIIFDIQSELI